MNEIMRKSAEILKKYRTGEERILKLENIGGEAFSTSKICRRF